MALRHFDVEISGGTVRMYSNGDVVGMDGRMTYDHSDEAAVAHMFLILGWTLPVGQQPFEFRPGFMLFRVTKKDLARMKTVRA